MFMQNIKKYGKNESETMHNPDWSKDKIYAVWLESKVANNSVTNKKKGCRISGDDEVTDMSSDERHWDLNCVA